MSLMRFTGNRNGGSNPSPLRHAGLFFCLTPSPSAGPWCVVPGAMGGPTMTTPPDILDTLAKRVENASSLEELRTALIAFQEEVESHHDDTDVEDALREYIDLDHLPTFGGEPPKNLDGVRSWDKDRLLVGAGGEFWYLEFVERKEQPTPENDKETKDLEALPDKVRSQ